MGSAPSQDAKAVVLDLMNPVGARAAALLPLGGGRARMGDFGGLNAVEAHGTLT